MGRSLFISISLLLSLCLLLHVGWPTPVANSGRPVKRRLVQDAGCLASSVLLPNSSSDPAFVQLIATSNAVLGK
jgi:hypothetical protein